METLDATPSHRRVPRTWLVAGAVIVALVAAWVLTAPDDIVTPGGIAGVPAGSIYVGYYPLSDRDLVIESIEPWTINELDVRPWLCHPVAGSDPIGVVAVRSITEFCASVEPFVGGAVVTGHGGGWPPMEQYLILEVNSTSPQPQAVCALDITYRRADGWRTGRQRNSGPYQVVVNGPPGDDWDAVLSACDSR